MAAPVVVGDPTTFAAATSGTSVTLAKPSGVQDGDLLVAALRANGTTSTDDYALSGWTRRGYDFIPSDAAGRVLGIYTHPVTDAASEPAEYVFSKTVADSRRVGAMFIVRGVDLANPVMGNSANWSSLGTTVTIQSYPLDATDQSLEVFAWGTEIVSPNASEPTATPGTAIALVPSSTGTSATRSTLWVGAREVAAATAGNVPLTWASASGSSASAVTLRGISEPVDPPRGFRSVGEALGKPGATWAHRGGSANWPEMSEVAYERSVAAGYGGLEFSAQRTSDGVWFGMHDNNFDRVSGVTGSPAPSTLTWADVQATYANVLKPLPGEASQPFYRLVDMLDRFTPTHIVVADPKNAIGAHDAEFLDLLDAHGGPAKIIVKFSGVGTGAAALANAARARGYQTWGYFYETDYTSGALDTWQSHWTLLGMEIGASTAAWNAALSYGKPVVGHIASSQANYNTAIAKGARMVQTSAVASVAAVGATNTQPWDAAFLGDQIVDQVYLGADPIWP